MRTRITLVFVLTLAAAGCGGDAASERDPAPDADVAAEVADAAETVGSSEVDSAEISEVSEIVEDSEIAEDSEPARVPLAGFGLISGDCGELDVELTSDEPAFFVNHLDFGADGWEAEAELALLTPGGQEIWADGNAGGSSIESEIFAFEVLARCELATLVKTETEIGYDVEGKTTDLLVMIDELPIGVSVTRAVSFPHDSPYTVEAAADILDKKLSDILVASANVSAEDQWRKQILHVLAYDAPHVASLETAYDALPPEVRADTIVIVTVTDGDDAVIY